jgi:RNA polymerase sigma factor (sigma-70 family)
VATLLTDAELLTSFVSDKREEAFEELIRRYGPLVLATCRRTIQDEQVVQEAFQATFLVLANNAGSLRSSYALALWLHKVAYRVTSRLRGNFLETRKREVSLDEALEVPMEEEQLEWKELRPILDEELNRMPEKYRAPLVLCYLDGKTNDEAAQLLNWPIGSISRRLDRAREILRTRLTKRGIVVSTVFLFTLLQEKVTAATVPSELLISTKKAAILIATHKATTGVISANVAPLMKETMKAMFMEKLKLATAVIFTIATISTSSLVIAQNSKNGASTEPQNGLVGARVGEPVAHPNVPQKAWSQAQNPQVKSSQIGSGGGANVPNRHPPNGKLDSIIIENLQFDNTPLATALTQLADLSRDADPAHEGVTFNVDELRSSLPVTLKLNKVSLRSAIRSICAITQQSYKVEKNSVVLLQMPVRKNAEEFRK